MTSSAPPRQRLLDTAAELFYREGVNTGVEALCKAAGVSKRTMYQLFGTKDALIAEALSVSGVRHQALLLPAPDEGAGPRDRILSVFRQLDHLSAQPGYQGCPFVSTAVELKDAAHPASRVARDSKDALTAFFRTEAAAAGAADPETLARQLTVVFDGAGVRSVVQSAPLDGLAAATAALLLDAALG